MKSDFLFAMVANITYWVALKLRRFIKRPETAAAELSTGCGWRNEPDPFDPGR
jgi:hypothetical protein